MTTDTTKVTKVASDERFDRAWDRLNDLETKLLRVKNLTEVLWMAGDSLSDREKQNAITTQCDVIHEVLREALDIRSAAAAMMLGRAQA